MARYAPGEGGEIQNWLACGPLTKPLEDLDRIVESEGSPFGAGGRWVISNAPDSLELKERAYRELSRRSWSPGARPRLHGPGPLGKKAWRYVLAGEDQVVDMSLFNFALTWMEGWTYACLLCDQALTIPAELLTVGPAEAWLNGERVKQHAGFAYVEPDVIPLTLSLSSGWNELWLHAQMIGWREARMAVGLRLLDRAGVTVGFPLGEVSEQHWMCAEENLSKVRVERCPFPGGSIAFKLDSQAPRGFEFVTEVGIPFPDDHVTLPVDITQFSSLAERGRFDLQPGESVTMQIKPNLLETLSYLPNEFHLRAQLRPADGTPLQVNHLFWGRAGDFSQATYGDYETRRLEALEHLSHMSYSVIGALAAVEINKAGIIPLEAVELACSFLEKRYDCADFYAIDLLVLYFLYADHPALRAQVKERIERAFLDFKFWIDEPGLDAMCYHTENHQILFHVSAYLAGELWPERIFPNSGLSGRRQKARARPRIAEWIRRRLGGAFSEWDSSSYLALDAYAMLALVEFAGSARLRQMAAALLDKIFFSLACQSWRGVHGCTHGRAYASTLKSARLENTSGLQRLAWGMGTFNGENRATGLLALARRYRVPDLIRQIGADLPGQLVTRARSSGRYRPRFDLRGDPWEVNTLTYRTPDGMLSAALDYQPGDMGWQEHLWQATLSPEAVVFTTHPGNSREDEIARPNFWAGSARLPRVAMYDNTIICLYDLSLGGGLDFSHAYFPTAAFDETIISDAWAFGRVGNGYVALGGDGNLKLITHGAHAGREIRTQGPGYVWLCVLGSAAEHGDFAGFCRRAAANPLHASGLEVKWTTLEGMKLAFGWDGPLWADGEPQPLGYFPHYENCYTHTPFSAERMTIRHAGRHLTLDLKTGRRIT